MPVWLMAMFALNPAVIAGLIAAGVLILIILVCLLWDQIILFLRGIENLVMSDPAHTAFSYQDRMDNGDFETVYGVFNKSTNNIVKGQVARSKTVDAETAKAHAGEKVVIYN